MIDVLCNSFLSILQAIIPSIFRFNHPKCVISSSEYMMVAVGVVMQSLMAINIAKPLSSVQADIHAYRPAAECVICRGLRIYRTDMWKDDALFAKVKLPQAWRGLKF